MANQRDRQKKRRPAPRGLLPRLARALALVAAGGAMAAPAHAEPQRTEHFEWKGTMRAEGALFLRGINGSAVVSGRPGEAVTVRAVKRSRRRPPQEVHIAVVPHGADLTICALYPAPAGEPAPECRPGGGGRNSARDSDVVVDFEVQVPRTVRLDLQTTNGRVAATGFTAGAKARTTNGSVDVDGAGPLKAEATNGSVTARSSGAAPLDLRTVNGAVTLSLPRDASATIEGSLLNGSIQSDFPLDVRAQHVSGQLGNGGPPIKLHTVNGRLALRRH